MYKIKIALLLLIPFSFLITKGISEYIIFILLYFIGALTLKLYKQDKIGQFLFFVSLFTSFLYALVLYKYMTYNNYSYLHSYDGFNVYIPYTEELLKSKYLPELINEIYSTSKYSFVGSILIPFVYIGKLSVFLGGGLYLPIQIVIMFFAAMTVVVIYNILLINRIASKDAIKYTLFYSLVSIQFYMSTYIVRDMPITLFITLLILISFKISSLKNIVTMVLLVLLIMSIRLSSGIFASVYILLVVFMSAKDKSLFRKIKGYILIIPILILLMNYYEIINEVFDEKTEIYEGIQLEDQAGASTIAAFNVLPPGFSHMAKTIYNQIMPIPSWRNMIQTSYRPEVYNITNFPIIPATFFRYVMWSIILVGLFNPRIRKLLINNKIVLFNFLIAILFLMLQSSTMGHRRMLGVYPIFFLVAILFYENYNKQGKRNLILLPTLIFFLAQIVGIKYLG